MRAGRRQAFRASYRSARRRTIEARAGDVAPEPISRSCGNLVETGAGSYNIESVAVICDIALQVARQWEMECAANPTATGTSMRESFATTQTGFELGTLTCTGGSLQVTFETGA